MLIRELSRLEENLFELGARACLHQTAYSLELGSHPIRGVVRCRFARGRLENRGNLRL